MSGKLRIGVDIDDVVADLLTAWLNRFNEDNVTMFTPADLTQWDLAADLGCGRDAIFKHLTPDVYGEVLPFGGAKEALNEIEALGHEVIFVTNCASNDRAKNIAMLDAKVNWLATYGLGAPYGMDTLLAKRCVVGCGHGLLYQSKNEVGVDWLIDDHIGNLEKFTRGYPILVTRPHNRLLKWEGKRIKHLRDVVPMLKYAVEVEREGKIYGHASKDVSVVTPQPGDEDMTPAVRQFETGATRDTDTGKLDYEAFFSPAVLKRRAEFMHKNRFQRDGSMRAGDNWQKGIPTDVYMKSLARHFMTVWQDYRAGKPLPQEELCAVMFNAEGLLHEDLKKVAS